MSNFQFRISKWMDLVFSNKEIEDSKERSLRVIEEAIELAQSCNVEPKSIHNLVDYVYNRPKGIPANEIAGCLVTIYAIANCLEIDADSVLSLEIKRIHEPEVIKRVQSRQHEKREIAEGK